MNNIKMFFQSCLPESFEEDTIIGMSVGDFTPLPVYLKIEEEM